MERGQDRRSSENISNSIFIDGSECEYEPMGSEMATVLFQGSGVDLPNSLSSSALYTESLNMNLGPSIHFIANTFFELSLRDSSKRGTGKINWLY